MEVVLAILLGAVLPIAWGILLGWGLVKVSEGARPIAATWNLLVKVVHWYGDAMTGAMSTLERNLRQRTDPLDWDEVRQLSKEYGLPFPEDYLADGLRELDAWHKGQVNAL